MHNFVFFYIHTYSYVRYLLLKSLKKLMCKIYVRKQIGIFTTLESACFHRRIWSKKINRELKWSHMMKHNNFQWAYHITLHPPPTPPKQGKLTEGSLNPVKIQKCTQNWLVVEAYPYVSFSRKDGSLPGNALCREVSTNWNETIWKKPACGNEAKPRL